MRFLAILFVFLTKSIPFMDFKVRTTVLVRENESKMVFASFDLNQEAPLIRPLGK